MALEKRSIDIELLVLIFGHETLGFVRFLFQNHTSRVCRMEIHKALGNSGCPP